MDAAKSLSGRWIGGRRPFGRSCSRLFASNSDAAGYDARKQVKRYEYVTGRGEADRPLASNIRWGIYAEWHASVAALRQLLPLPCCFSAVDNESRSITWHRQKSKLGLTVQRRSAQQRSRDFGNRQANDRFDVPRGGIMVFWILQH